MVTTGVDIDRLPPTQFLILEVLAARHRLGETLWTFPASLKPAVAALDRLGLVWQASGVVEYTIRAGLTDAGRAACVSGDYVPPFAKPIERVRRLCEAARDDGTDLFRLAPSQVLAALDGRAS